MPFICNKKNFLSRPGKITNFTQVRDMKNLSITAQHFVVQQIVFERSAIKYVTCSTAVTDLLLTRVKHLYGYE